MRVRLARLLLPVALALAAPAVGAERTLREIVAMHAGTAAQEDPGRVARGEAVRGRAFRFAAQHAWDREMRRLEAELIAHGPEIDKVYDFGLLMKAFPQQDRGAHLLPPAVRHMDERTDALPDGTRIVRESGVWEIAEPARLVPQPPNWRSWLILSDRASVADPHPSQLPKGRWERRQWEAGAREGWDAGTAQARYEMVSRMTGLQGAYAGRVRYLRLLLEGRISPPEVEGEVIHARIDGAVLAEVTERHSIRSRSAFAEPDAWRLFAIDPADGFPPEPAP